MPHYAALDVSQEMTSVCLVDETGRVVGEAKLPTCPDAITAWLGKKAADLTRVGLETGPMAVWLWNELHARALPVICLDARQWADAQTPVRGGHDAPDPYDPLLPSEGLGLAAGQGVSVQEGTRGGRA